MTEQVERVYYADAGGTWHVGMLDDTGTLTVTDGHAPAEGRDVYHELPQHVDGEDLCAECHG
jgi:hypothetical protein